jgi:transcription initiation factor TFIIIB Brf1 subunit/transcription initiation factor TFIIB
MSVALGLPDDVVEEGCRLMHSAFNEGFLVGRSIERVASAGVYAAIRLYDYPRLLVDVARVSKFGRFLIARSYWKLVRDLGLDPEVKNPLIYYSRYISQMCLTSDIEQRGNELLSKAVEQGLSSGRSSRGLIGGVIYAAVRVEGGHVTQRRISEVIGVSCRTIRDRFKEVMREICGREPITTE